MSAQKPGLWERIAAHPWRVALAAFVLVYCPLLGFVSTTTISSAEADAQHRIEQIMSRPPKPPPPLPVLKSFETFDLVMQRDPLQPLERNVSAPKPGGAATAASDSIRFVASYRDASRLCAVSRDGAGQLARFCIGDKIADGTIERVDHASVTINAGGQRTVVNIVPGAPAH